MSNFLDETPKNASSQLYSYNRNSHSPWSINTQTELYDMSHPKRGIALIFNHTSFRDGRLSKRLGADKDRIRLKKILEQLLFEVRVYEDYTWRDIVNILENVSNEDHSQNDCLLVAVLSHGKKDVLYASDREYRIETLWDYFIGDSCKTLVGKPKLFFIQACRGDKLDSGVSVVHDGNGQENGDKVEGPIHYYIPQMADILVMYSTFDGFASWRNKEQGSWFIQSLCNELLRHYTNRDLLRILTGVNRHVAYSYQSSVSGDESLNKKKQMPCIISMLTKELYFTKK